MKSDSVESQLFRIFPRTASSVVAWAALTRADPQERRRHGDLIDRSLQAVGLASEETKSALLRLPATLLAEQRLIRFGSVEYLRSIQNEPGGIGLEPLLEVKAQGRGLILGCTHIGSFYHALIQARRLAPELLVVTGNQVYSPAMVRRLCELSGVEIRIVSAATRSALTIARHLKRGGVVATMLDLYVEATLSIAVPFFGKPAATPAGIFQLANATQTPLVTLCVTTHPDGRKTVEIDSVLEPGATVMESASEANRRVEAMIRRHARSWPIWPSLAYRWGLAEQGASALAEPAPTMAVAHP